MAEYIAPSGGYFCGITFVTEDPKPLYLPLLAVEALVHIVDGTTYQARIMMNTYIILVCFKSPPKSP